MGSNAKVVYGRDSFDFDVANLKPVPSKLPKASVSATMQSDTPLALNLTAGGTSSGNKALYVTSKGADGNVSEGGTEGRVGKFSSQTSTQSDGSTQESGDHTDDEINKVVMMKRSIDANTLKEFGGVRKDSAGAEGEGEVVKRPFTRQVSTGQGKHVLCAGCKDLPANSLGKPKSDNKERDFMSMQDVETLLANQLEDLKKELAAKDDLLQRYSDASNGRRTAGGRGREREGSPQGELSVKEQYDHQRQVTTELQRLHSIEEHDKLVREELGECKKDKNCYESQVVLLTKKLSLSENEKADLWNNFTKLSEENESLLSLRAENTILQTGITTLEKDLVKKDINLQKLKDHVNRVTQPMSLADEEPRSLPSGTLEGEGVAGSEGLVVREGLKQRPQTSQFPRSVSSGKSFGEEHESELAKLYQEMTMKDEVIEKQAKQLGKFESTAKKLTALMVYNEKANSAMKSLSEKCGALEVCGNQYYS